MEQSIRHCITLCDLYYVIWAVVWQFLNFVLTLFIGLFCINLVCHLHVREVREHSRIFLITWHFVFHSFYPLRFPNPVRVYNVINMSDHVGIFELLKLYIVTLAVEGRFWCWADVSAFSGHLHWRTINIILKC